MQTFRITIAGPDGFSRTIFVRANSAAEARQNALQWGQGHGFGGVQGGNVTEMTPVDISNVPQGSTLVGPGGDVLPLDSIQAAQREADRTTPPQTGQAFDPSDPFAGLGHTPTISPRTGLPMGQPVNVPSPNVAGTGAGLPPAPAQTGPLGGPGAPMAAGPFPGDQSVFEDVLPGASFRDFITQRGVRPDSLTGQIMQSRLPQAQTAFQLGQGAGLIGQDVMGAPLPFQAFLGQSGIGRGLNQQALDIFNRLAAGQTGPGATFEPNLQFMSGGGFQFPADAQALTGLARQASGAFMTPTATQFFTPGDQRIQQRLQDATFAGQEPQDFMAFLRQQFNIPAGGL